MQELRPHSALREKCVRQVLEHPASIGRIPDDGGFDDIAAQNGKPNIGVKINVA